MAIIVSCPRLSIFSLVKIKKATKITSILVGIAAVGWGVIIMFFGQSKFGRAIGVSIPYTIVGVVGFLSLGGITFLGIYNLKKEKALFLFINVVACGALMILFISSLCIFMRKRNDFIFALNIACDSDRNYIYKDVTNLFSMYPDPYKFGVSSKCPIKPFQDNAKRLITDKFNMYGIYFLNINEQKGYSQIPQDPTDLCYQELYNPSTTIYAKKYSKYVRDFFAELESKHNCTSICTESPINYFSDSTITPGGICRHQIESIAKLHFICCICVSGFTLGCILSALLFSILLWLHPGNVGNKLDEENKEWQHNYFNK